MSPTVTEALGLALAAATVSELDSAAVALAEQYALSIDEDPGELRALGPLLLNVLTALRLTPAARTGVMAGGVSHGSQSLALDELRNRRRARLDGSAIVDATAG